jgi:hypothetical protein
MMIFPGRLEESLAGGTAARISSAHGRSTILSKKGTM